MNEMILLYVEKCTAFVAEKNFLCDDGGSPSFEELKGILNRDLSVGEEGLVRVALYRCLKERAVEVIKEELRGRDSWRGFVWPDSEFFGVYSEVSKACISWLNTFFGFSDIGEADYNTVDVDICGGTETITVLEADTRPYYSDSAREFEFYSDVYVNSKEIGEEYVRYILWNIFSENLNGKTIQEYVRHITKKFCELYLYGVITPENEVKDFSFAAKLAERLRELTLEEEIISLIELSKEYFLSFSIENFNYDLGFHKYTRYDKRPGQRYAKSTVQKEKHVNLLSGAVYAAVEKQFNDKIPLDTIKELVQVDLNRAYENYYEIEASRIVFTCDLGDVKFLTETQYINDFLGIYSQNDLFNMYSENVDIYDRPSLVQLFNAGLKANNILIDNPLEILQNQSDIFIDLTIQAYNHNRGHKKDLPGDRALLKGYGLKSYLLDTPEEIQQKIERDLYITVNIESISGKLRENLQSLYNSHCMLNNLPERILPNVTRTPLLTPPGTIPFIPPGGIIPPGIPPPPLI